MRPENSSKDVLKMPFVIYNHRIRWVAAINMAFAVAGIWFVLRVVESGFLYYVTIVFLTLFALFWIHDLLFGMKLMLVGDGSTLRWQDDKATGSVALADIRKVLIGVTTTQVGGGVIGWTYIRFVLESGVECALPPNIAAGLQARSWRKLKQLVAYIRTIASVTVEPINQQGVVLRGWKDDS